MTTRTYGRDINETKNMLYSRGKEFNGFESLTDEDQKRILEFAQMKIQDFKKSSITGIKTNRDLYIETVEALVKPGIYQRLKNFDEKIFFLINVVDPKLKCYNASIQTADNEDLERSMTKAAGFYDKNLISYEDTYRKKFVKDQEFAQDIKKNYLNRIFIFLRPTYTFDKIKPERYQQIEELAKNWIASVNNPKDANSLAYSIFKQSNLLPVKSLEEIVCLFILCIDPDLNALRIYEEESDTAKLIERSISELGFYNKDLIEKEKTFHKVFMPNKVVSEWSLV